MTSATSVLIDIYGPVIVAAFLMFLGFISKQMWSSRKELRSRMDTLIQETGRIKDSHDSLARDIEQFKREFPPVKENLAILASQVDSHERWHERNPYRG